MRTRAVKGGAMAGVPRAMVGAEGAAGGQADPRRVQRPVLAAVQQLQSRRPRARHTTTVFKNNPNDGLFHAYAYPAPHLEDTRSAQIH